MKRLLIGGLFVLLPALASAQVAFDAVTESHTGTTGSASEASFNISHTPVGTPRGVLVFILVGNSVGAPTDPVTGITYGGTALTQVPSCTGTDTADEPANANAWFLGASVPTGAVTVTVSRNNNAVVVYAVVFTVTANGDTEATGCVPHSENSSLSVVAVDDGSPGTNSVRFAAVSSGAGAPPAVGAGTTAGPSIDFGVNSASTGYETTAGQGSRSVGFSEGASDDRAAVYLAVRQAAAGNTCTGALLLTGAGKCEY